MTARERLDADTMRPRLEGRLGTPWLWFETCASTQEALRGTDLPEGAVAVAEHQTAGRGRSGRTWEDAPSRAILVTVLLRPPTGRVLPELSLVAGLACAEAVEAATGLDALVKWPNDVVVADRKVAGLLLELDGGAVLCGIGINVAQRAHELPTTRAELPAGSLQLATGREVDRAALLAALLRTLELRYDAWAEHGIEPLLAELERRNWLRGRAVRVGGARATAGAIAPDGRLAVSLADGSTSLVSSGEVTLASERDERQEPAATGDGGR